MGLAIPPPLKRCARWLALLAASCLLIGGAAAGFLWALEEVTQVFASHPWLIFSLPLLGWAMVWFYDHPAKDAQGGVRSLLAQLRTPTTPLSPIMAPAIVGSTLLSHLGGASVGREGTALQMGGGLADLLGRFGRVVGEERRTLLLCGVSAGFGAVFGTPWAAAVFALEFVSLTTGWWYRLPLCLLSSVGADLVGRRLFGVVHGDFRLVLPPSWEPAGFLWAALLGVAFGLVARVYLRWVTHCPELKPQGALGTPYRVILAFGLLYVGLVWFGGLEDFSGLSLPLAHSASQHPMHPLVPVVKLLLTAICVGGGFRGGEVTPLFVIGATLGSALADLTSLPVSVAAALGFVGVFAGAGTVPLACTIMATEIFDPTLAPLAAVACIASRLVAGKRGLYSE